MTKAIDACFVSYDEPLADELHTRAESVLGRHVKRVHGVQGMRAAYLQAANAVETDQFFLIDADLELDVTFNASVVDPLGSDVAVRVWQTRNPLNGLEYGHGGLKLCRRNRFDSLDDTTIDVIAGLPGRKEFEQNVAGTTRFNQSPFHAWRAAFRECAKLRRGSEYGLSPDHDARVNAWLAIAPDNGAFAEDALRGARAGVAFAARSDHEEPKWSALQDLDWLLLTFTTQRMT